MIHEIRIGATDADDGGYYEPPTRMLSLAVIGGEAYLEVRTATGEGQLGAKPAYQVQVPARSLLLALQAGIEASSRPQRQPDDQA